MRKSSHFTEYKYDLSLEDSNSNRFMVWIIACFVFIATLVLLSAISAHKMIDDWQDFATRHATLEVPYSDTADETAQKIAEAITPLAAVEKAEILPPSDTAAMVADSLGRAAPEDTIDPALLPLPVLVKITLGDTNETALEEVENKIRSIDSKASLQRHKNWAKDILNYGETLYTGALILLILMGSMTVLTLIWTLTARINIHHDEIETLTIIGADDRYIARQFQHFALSRTLAGCLIGLGGAVIVVAAVAFKLSGQFTWSWANMLALFEWLCLPVLICMVISYITCRITLARNLARLH